MEAGSAIGKLGRGSGDYARSHCIEDIMAIVDGRPELLDEIAAAPANVVEYLGSDEEQSRVPIVMERLRRVALPRPRS
jgi:hypothetical protein